MCFPKKCCRHIELVLVTIIYSFLSFCFFILPWPEGFFIRCLAIKPDVSTCCQLGRDVSHDALYRLMLALKRLERPLPIRLSVSLSVLFIGLDCRKELGCSPIATWAVCEVLISADSASSLGLKLKFAGSHGKIGSLSKSGSGEHNLGRSTALLSFLSVVCYIVDWSSSCFKQVSLHLWAISWYLVWPEKPTQVPPFSHYLLKWSNFPIPHLASHEWVIHWNDIRLARFECNFLEWPVCSGWCTSEKKPPLDLWCYRQYSGQTFSCIITRGSSAN